LVETQEFTKYEFLIRVNIAVSCFNNRYFTKLSQDFLQHRGKPEVLKETWVEQFPALAGFTVPG
jgi:hypothetical protein